MHTVRNSGLTITYELGGNLYINITNRCPCACDFCVRTTTSGHMGDADSLWLEREPALEEILADLDARDLSKYGEVVFCGFGEPTERLEVMLAVCRHLKQNPAQKIRLNTNGLSDLINGRDTSRDFEGLFDTLSVSLNASDAEKYNELCHPAYGLEAFPAILRFTQNVVPLVPQVVMSVVDTLPPDELDKCRKLCEDCGATLRVRTLIED